MIGKYLKSKTKIHPSVFIAPGVQIVGAVVIGEGSSIWHNSVLRADINTITIGKNVNIQDNCVMHLEDEQGVLIGDGVSVGHGAILHACTIKKGALIGMGSIILSGAVVGEQSIVAAGSLVTGKTKIPKQSLVMGSPAKVVRKLTPDEIKKNRYWSDKYTKLAKEYLVW